MNKCIILKTKNKGVVITNRLKPGTALFRFDKNGLFMTTNLGLIARAKPRFEHEMFDSVEEAKVRFEELTKEIEKDAKVDVSEQDEKQEKDDEEKTDKEEVKQEVLDETTPEVDLMTMKKGEIIKYARQTLGLKVNDRLKKDELIIEIGKQLARKENINE